MIIELNDHFRVTTVDGPLQWVLQKHSFNNGEDVWHSMSWCQTRHGLLTAVREKVQQGADYYPQGVAKAGLSLSPR